MDLTKELQSYIRKFDSSVVHREYFKLESPSFPIPSLHKPAPSPPNKSLTSTASNRKVIHAADLEAEMFAKAKQDRPIKPTYAKIDSATEIDKNQYLLNGKNPFARDLSQFTIDMGDSLSVDNSVKFKTWFYKDLSGTIYGPYNSLDMYQWSVCKFFPDDLLICCNSKNEFGQFQPLNSYEPKEEIELNVLRSLEKLCGFSERSRN